MIQVKELTKRYGNHIAVDHLSFTVEKGEICGLLGPNGAGKSTTMNMMTGYISATDGTALIDGSDIFDEPRAARAKIGYLPEQPPVYLDMTPWEYLLFVAQLKGFAKPDRQDLAKQAMAQTGVTEVKDRLIKNLSKGYRQRVGLAGALLGGPEVLILDEPTVGLDPKQIIEIRELIRSLAKKHTILLSSHILSEVAAVCDKVLILSHGKLVACDTPENLAQRAEGQNVLIVTALGDEKTVRSVLNSVEGARDVAFEPCLDEGAVTARLSYDTGRDLRAQISSALAAAGCAVLRMQNETLSLEDVFLELTGDRVLEDAEVLTELPERESSAEDGEISAQNNEEEEEKDHAGDL